MAPMIKQTIQQKKLSFWKLLFMIFSATFVMNMAIKVFTAISPEMGTIGGIGALLLSSVACMRIIYKHIAYYNYKLIDDDLIMERVFGRANHLFLSLKLSELERFYPYKELDGKNEKGDRRLYKFVTGNNHDRWYVGDFTRSGDRYRFIIEPNEVLLRAILSAYIKEQ
ncbi:hypothetical protein [Thermotalea metallivorans]|uniref:Uncharacterized protein n=1 Tax=Thermotalea metallivorans TaxID=520762 RepID=A0A140L0U2_9FIRM|nr:hypothetical protein [Thermotalea metallivorans]KXG74167.1 hypothetical protein AN619_25860 [Thermotalea metallivorans]